PENLKLGVVQSLDHEVQKAENGVPELGDLVRELGGIAFDPFPRELPAQVHVAQAVHQVFSLRPRAVGCLLRQTVLVLRQSQLCSVLKGENESRWKKSRSQEEET